MKMFTCAYKLWRHEGALPCGKPAPFLHAEKETDRTYCKKHHDRLVCTNPALDWMNIETGERGV